MAAKPRIFTCAELKIYLLKHAANINEQNSYKINSYTEATMSPFKGRQVSIISAGDKYCL
jgi:hypothetical protein